MHSGNIDQRESDAIGKTGITKGRLVYLLSLLVFQMIVITLKAFILLVCVVPEKQIHYLDIASAMLYQTS